MRRGTVDDLAAGGRDEQVRRSCRHDAPRVDVIRIERHRPRDRGGGDGALSGRGRPLPHRDGEALPVALDPQRQFVAADPLDVLTRADLRAANPRLSLGRGKFLVRDQTG